MKYKVVIKIKVRLQIQGVDYLVPYSNDVIQVLEEGCEKMKETYAKMKDLKLYDQGLIWNTDLIETLELQV